MATQNASEFSNEYQGTAPATDLPEGVATSKEKKTYEMKDGSQGSRAAFIKEIFVEDKLSRTDIAEQFGFAYRDVYTATINMTNGTESGTRGRAQTNSTITVTVGDHQLVMGDDENGYTLNGEETEAADVKKLATEEMCRNDWIKEQVANGVERGTIAKMLDLSYGVIYGITKDSEGTRQRYEYDLEGEKVSRSAYIRHLYDNGKTRAEIQKVLEVPYQVVWQATKTEKEVLTGTEKFEGIITELEAFTDKVEEAHSKNFAKVIEVLRTIVLVAPEAEEVEDEDE